MIIEFPFLKGSEENTLFIIGNGFDLFHGALTKYKHFCSWLNLNGAEEFVSEMQEVFYKLDGKLDSLWSNFEEALGDYNIDRVYQLYYKSPKDSLGENKHKIASNKVVDNVRQLCNMVRPELKRWASKIPIDNIEKKISLSINSWYLTFNFTKILENIYGIPSDHICHIHGSIDDNEEIITGHSQYIVPKYYDAKTDEEERAKQKIKEILLDLSKKQEKQIEKNQTFFLSLPKLTHIVVIGHSLADIDLRYFGHIISMIDKETIWHFSYHSEKDKNNIANFRQECVKNSYTINEGESIIL